MENRTGKQLKEKALDPSPEFCLDGAATMIFVALPGQKEAPRRSITSSPMNEATYEDDSLL